MHEQEQACEVTSGGGSLVQSTAQSTGVTFEQPAFMAR